MPFGSVERATDQQTNPIVSLMELLGMNIPGSMGGMPAAPIATPSPMPESAPGGMIDQMGLPAPMPVQTPMSFQGGGPAPMQGMTAKMSSVPNYQGGGPAPVSGQVPGEVPGPAAGPVDAEQGGLGPDMLAALAAIQAPEDPEMMPAPSAPARPQGIDPGLLMEAIMKLGIHPGQFPGLSQQLKGL